MDCNVEGLYLLGLIFRRRETRICAGCRVLSLNECSNQEKVSEPRWGHWGTDFHRYLSRNQPCIHVRFLEFFIGHLRILGMPGENVLRTWTYNSSSAANIHCMSGGIVRQRVNFSCLQRDNCLRAIPLSVISVHPFFMSLHTGIFSVVVSYFYFVDIWALWSSSRSLNVKRDSDKVIIFRSLFDCAAVVSALWICGLLQLFCLCIGYEKKNY